MKSLNMLEAYTRFKLGLFAALLLCAFGSQSASAQDTLISSVTITTVDSSTVADTARWDVKFKIDTTGTNGNANGGWIIQKITMSRVVYPCPEKENNKPIFDSTIVYWEVWPVSPGEDTTTSELPNGADDSFSCDLTSANAPDNTYGTFTVVAVMAYINDPGGGLPPTPGHPGGADTNRTDAGGSTWAPGGVTQAGGLVATTTEPSFWKKLEDSGKASTRTWTVSWNKCKDADQDEVRDEEHDGGRDEDGDGRGRTPATVGLDSDATQSVRFFPNPAQNEIRITGSKTIKTTIFNISGQVLIESYDNIINMDKLTSGTYIIQLDDGQKIQTEKLIIH